MKKILLPALCCAILSVNAQTTYYEDDFEGYNTVETVAGQGDFWEAWSCNDYGSESLFISDEQANSGTQSVMIGQGGGDLGVADMLLVLGESPQAENTYTLSWSMYIPQDAVAYFGLLYSWGCNGSNTEYGTEVNFNADGNVYTGEESDDFSFPNDSWFDVVVEVDIDAFFHTISINGTQIHQGIWSSQGENNQFHGINFSGFTSSSAIGEYYLDDVLVTETGFVGLAENQEAKITLSPNPAISNTMISGLNINSMLRVLDMSGKLVHEQIVTNSTLNLNTNDLSDGMYIVETSSPTGPFQRQKLIVRK